MQSPVLYQPGPEAGGNGRRRAPAASGKKMQDADQQHSARRHSPLALRLSVLMFLQYAIIGAWSPVFGPYLKSLPLTNTQTAWIWTTAALGSMLAPVVWGQIADRWLAAERCISLCAAVA